MTNINDYITKEGYEKIDKKVATLIEKRPHLLELVVRAREIGGDDNTDLSSAVKVVEELDETISKLNQIIYNSEIKQSIQSDVVGFGDVITIESDKTGTNTYKLIGTNEISYWDNGVSVCSPVGSAMIGKMVGDEVDVEIPSGEDTFIITAIEQSPYNN